MLAMNVYASNLVRAVERKKNIERSATSAGAKLDFIEAVDGRHLTDEQKAFVNHSSRTKMTTPTPGNQWQKSSARWIDDMCWLDRLLFMAIGGCILSASGVVPKVLSSVAVEFLLVCSLLLTVAMLFWLLCPASITGVLAVHRFRARGAPEKHGQSH
jgi:hypothetical protein